jgi:outer membrane protein W
MVRKSLIAVLVVLAVGAVATPARAQSMMINFNVGYLMIRGQDARLAEGDIIATELNGSFVNALNFDFNHFNRATVGAEWLIGLGDFVEAGIGVGYYVSSVPSVSANFLNADGSEVAQTLRFRMVPITGTVRFLPLGHNRAIEPYIGAGIGVINWRYSEVGQFVGAQAADGTYPIFTATYAGTGTNITPVVLGGARFPFGRYSLGGEIRWQRGTGTLNTADFLSDKIDLGGVTYQMTFGVRF